MTSDLGKLPEYEIIVGALCLDFVNTLEDRPSPEPVERLQRYPDVLEWTKQAGALTDDQVNSLLDIAADDMGAAAIAVVGFRDLRESMYRIFVAVAWGESPAAADIDTLNAALADALAPSYLVPKGGRFVISWRDDTEALDRVVWPIVRSAVDLLTSDLLDRVTLCSGRTCEWIFLDESRNHSRRWCDMKTCGNQAKARAFYRRSKAQGAN